MGFTKSMAKAALKQNGNNFEKSLDKLLTNSDQFIGLDNSDDSNEEDGAGGHGVRDASDAMESLMGREEREM